MTGTRLAIVLAALAPVPARAEDGYELWPRHARVDNAARLNDYATAMWSILVAGDSPTAAATARELRRGLEGLLDRPVSTVTAGRRALVARRRRALLPDVLEAADPGRVRSAAAHARARPVHQPPLRAELTCP